MLCKIMQIVIQKVVLLPLAPPPPPLALPLLSDKDEGTRAGPPRPACGIKPAAGRYASRQSASQPSPESSDNQL